MIPLTEKSQKIFLSKEKQKSEHTPRVWLYHPGENACMWNDCLAQNKICIAWDEMGDLAVYRDIDDLTKALQEVYHKKDATFRNDRLALWQFVHEMQVGDIVYAKKGKNTILGRGIVKGEYVYDSSLSAYRNIRRVQWTHWKARNYEARKLIPDTMTDVDVYGSQPRTLVTKTLTDISSYADFVQNLNDLVGGGAGAEDNKNYWWLVASPDVWRFSDIGVGETEAYTLYNENGNKRRVFQNFLDAKTGDKVIGYASTPTLQIVALGEIARETDARQLYFRKTEQLLNPVDYSEIKKCSELQNMECMAGGGRGTLFKVTPEEYQILMEIIRAENPLPASAAMPSYADADFLDEVYMSADNLHRLKHLLQKKQNIILQGAPGVGKTFTAKRLAYVLMGVKDEQRVEMVQFHQNYTYEDFIMGYKPDETGGFELRHGVFYKFCKKAMNTPDKDFFFIIDEINRGNLSKIFGELLMLIENGYRGKEIKLAYTEELFSVPKNLYIIGMMNTADRSLAMIDYALRRRFSFFEMNPGFDTDGFKKYRSGLASERFDKIIEGVKHLNDIIADDDSLGAGFCIGHSYFCGQSSFDDEWLANVIEYDIAPMLCEYWFDDVQKYKMQIEQLRSLLK